MEADNGRKESSRAPYVTGITGGTGESLEDALVVCAPDTEMGVALEYDYVRALYGTAHEDWNLHRQYLLHHGGRRYDQLDIILADGTQKTLYFDITGFFGKW